MYTPILKNLRKNYANIGVNRIYDQIHDVNGKQAEKNKKHSERMKKFWEENIKEKRRYSLLAIKQHKLKKS